MKDTLVVRFLGAEQVVHDAYELVSRSGEGLGFAELPSDAPKKLTEIIFGIMQRVRGHSQGGGNAASDAATLGIEHFATTDLIFRAESQPRCKGVVDTNRVRFHESVADRPRGHDRRLLWLH